MKDDDFIQSREATEAVSSHLRRAGPLFSSSIRRAPDIAVSATTTTSALSRGMEFSLHHEKGSAAESSEKQPSSLLSKFAAR